eukprot:TRINITY_DN612_c0_g1_i2.p1 TRINITY_DN612_c0_g1~~TRINITY_DN612_c0_g1_i2.p1  ORF type:complete len:183 (-),score=21.60 TRINITY_DN612_c0_g1_i2:893-1441(-)
MLDPFSAESLREHWFEEYKGAVVKLNRQLLTVGGYGDFSLVDLIKANAGEISDLSCMVLNHYLYYCPLHPRPREFPMGRLGCLIDKSFGNFLTFKKLFKESAMNLFGSGWVFLAIDKEMNLHIISSETAGNPHQHDMIPLLALDMWEHSYYGDFRNDKASYIDSYIQFINWKVVNGILDHYF